MTEIPEIVEEKRCPRCDKLECEDSCPRCGNGCNLKPMTGHAVCISCMRRPKLTMVDFHLTPTTLKVTTGDGVRDVKEGWEGGVKFDSDKPRMELIDSYAAEELAKVLTFGAEKYAADNWRKGISYRRLIAAALRHTFALLRGEDNDAETGLSHAAHLMCCAMFLVWTVKHRPDMDDRWKDSRLNDDDRLKGHNVD